MWDEAGREKWLRAQYISSLLDPNKWEIKINNNRFVGDAIDNDTNNN